MARWVTLVFVVALTTALGSHCNQGDPPTVTLTLNAVDDDLNDLLIVPPSGFAVNASFSASGGATIDPQTFHLEAIPWDGGPSVVLTSTMTADPSGAVGIVPAGLPLAAPASYTLVAWVQTTTGGLGAGSFSFAVRDFPSGPPLATGQVIWYDFTADRDGDQSPDFPVDLQAVGLGSPLEPALSALVEANVIAALVARGQAAYHDEDPNGLGSDPVEIGFVTADPGPGDVTRVCVGGEAPGSPNLIGSILIDPGNGMRSSVECGTIPPTGIFPRGMLVYAGNAYFQQAFDPLMASRGGTPVGEHPLDAIVLDPGFDPGSATQAELDRYNDIQYAIQVYADSLGSIVAHETGHAVGLVEPNAPGLGLYGGSMGADYSHDVEADGSVPPENYLMKAGGTFSFQKLAGLSGNPLPFFRPLDFAYLRDRAVVDPSVTQLLPPPVATDVDPTLITESVTLTVTGSDFAPTPSLRLVTQGFSYDLIVEQFVSASEVTGFVSYSQVIAGTYYLEVKNPDGQIAVCPVAIVVQ